MARMAKPLPEPRRVFPRFRNWWRFLAAALVVYVGYTIWMSGAYKSADAFVAGQCSLIEAPAGPEDIVTLPDGARAIISATDRRDRQAPGALWFYDLGTTPGKLTRIPPPEGMPFRPLGIALYNAGAEGLYLQVINQRAEDRYSVEIFRLDGVAEGAALRHIGSVSSGLFVHPNSIAPVGPESFYLTNDRGEGPRWMHSVENILQLARSTVVYHGGTTTRIAAEEIAFANGIAVTPDSTTVMVGSTLWRMILIYSRDPVSGALNRTGSLRLPGGVDNLHFDDQGALWAAVHPNAFAFIGHAMDAAKESPSRVLRIARDLRGAVRVEEAFGDPGSLISAASVGAYKAGRLLIGNTFDPKMLDCRIDERQMREVD